MNIEKNEAAAGAVETATDIELAKAAAEGDMTAFEIIYKRHHRRVYSLCFRMLQNATEAEDITQETFMHLYRKIGLFRGDSEFSTWLHRLTVNQVLAYFRKRTVKFDKTIDDSEGETIILTAAADTSPNEVARRIAREAAMEQLPDNMRNVYVLHDVEGYETEEVARILRSNINQVKHDLHKARLKLRKILLNNNKESPY